MWTDFHKEHVEHNGNNDITNCVPSCKSCNSSKHVSDLEEWYTPDNSIYCEQRLIKIKHWLSQDVFNITQ
jgi:NAD-dependent DNA ligase